MAPIEVPEYRVHSQPSPVERWRHIVEIVALVGAGIWGFYVFIYQERIKPASESPNVQISRAVSHQALPANKELVTITMTMKNIGSTGISMAGLVVNAYGVRYTERSNTGIERPRPGRASGLSLINRGLANTKPVLLYSYASLFTPLGSTLTLRIASGEYFTILIPFVIHRGTYDTLRLSFARCDQRSDDNLSTPYTLKRTTDGAFDARDFAKKNATTHRGIHCNVALFAGGEYAL